jgi:carboxymethylenebutenolidase
MKKLLLAMLIAAVAGASSAQDWAKSKLEKSPRHQEWVKVKQGSREIDCFVVYPEVKEKATAVLVIHEIFGLTDWAREMADELAEAGYIAIAPDLLSGMGPSASGTTGFGGNDGAVRGVSSLPPDQVTADLKAALDYAAHLPACNGKVVAAGFCWGGGQAFRFATNSKEVKAAFVFYGPSPKNEAEYARIQCPVYGFYAGNDNRINASLNTTADAMKAAGKAFAPVTYDGAGHGFMRTGEAPDASADNKRGRTDAWVRLKELLKKN